MNIREEAARCLLCENAPCSRACPAGYDPARAVRAVNFENEKCALRYLGTACAECYAPCESACIHYDRQIRIKQLASALPEIKPAEADLSIEFCGVRCENPFFLSSSVVASSYEMVAKAFEMGWAGAVYKTIGFYIPQEVSPRFDAVRKEPAPHASL